MVATEKTTKYTTENDLTKKEKKEKKQEKNKTTTTNIYTDKWQVANIGGALCSMPQSLADAHY